MSNVSDRFNIRENSLIREAFYYTTHPTGVRIVICPKPELKTFYAAFATKYGSIDNEFSVNGGDYTRVPDGIAHYLEHKLFEDEEGDAFRRYEKTGASANAFTSREKTCYYFSCTRHFEQAFEVLLDFVQKPYFTPENVRKEQGIIAQEIKMSQDNPGSMVSSNLMRAMYRAHPIRDDIAGTVESISQITPELLYNCYNTFYNPNNMVLAVSGNVDPKRVLEMCDKLLLTREKFDVECRLPEDDGIIVQPFVEKAFDVPFPIFQLGFKESWRQVTERERILSGLIKKSVFGNISDFYDRMIQKKLINPGFRYGTIDVRGALGTVFKGMSRSPEALRDEIFEEIERVKRDGISPELFECARRNSYGGIIYSFNYTEDIADNLLDDIMFDIDTFAAIEAITNVTVDEANELFKLQYDISNSTLSVVRRSKEA